MPECHTSTHTITMSPRQTLPGALSWQIAVVVCMKRAGIELKGRSGCLTVALGELGVSGCHVVLWRSFWVPAVVLWPHSCLTVSSRMDFYMPKRGKKNKKRWMEQNKTTILHNSFHRPIQPYSPKLDISNSPLGDHGWAKPPVTMTISLRTF